MQSVWNLRQKNHSHAQKLSSSFDISTITAQLLLNRGIDQPDQVETFLHPQMDDLHEPEEFSQMEDALDLIHHHLQQENRIFVYGDYDVDGVTGAAILLNFFRLINRSPEYYVPDRIDEGFGLHSETLDRICKHQDPDLLISVDCGTSDRDVIQEARERGVDVIVLDHHEPPPELPPANAILNPKLKGESYPFSAISASGVSFKLVWGLAQSLSEGKRVKQEFREFLVNAIAMVGLGTIADRVPMYGENRIFAYYGLKILRSCENPGIKQLLKKAGISSDDISADDIGYKMAPPLNAAGRMQESHRALELFLAETEQEAKQLARELQHLNKKRRSVQSDVKKQVEQQVEENPEVGDQNVLVCAHEEWHPGVVGITASQITEQYGKPTVLIGTGVEPAKGSARSVEGFPLHEALESCTELLLQHGGHAMAAGLTVESDQISELRARLNEEFAERNAQNNGRANKRVLDIDLEVFLPNVDWRLLQEMNKLEPFGTNNPQPVLATTGLTLCEPPNLMGSSGDHLSFRVSQGGVQRRAVAFGMADRVSDLDRIDEENLALAYTPVINSWKGKNSVELHVKDIQSREEVELVSKDH